MSSPPRSARRGRPVARPTRRRLLRAAGSGAVFGLAGCGGAPGSRGATSTAAPSSAGVGLETVVAGLDAPVDVAFAPDADRRYVVEQFGVVRRHDAEGLADAPALDLRDAVLAGGERGMLGIALHPDFRANRRLFLRYTSPRRPGTPAAFDHTFVLAEFRATPDGRRIRRETERPLLELPEPQANHNGGSVVFGPDGYLYVGVGDGGGGGDRGTGHVGDWYGAVLGGNGQDVTHNLLGSVLRLDVDGTDGDRPYAVPDDNPLVDRTGLDEHFAWGFRNPWRLSFDGDDGYVADVGQSSWEEVDVLVSGGNYGWNVKEGTHCYGASTCPDRTPTTVRGGEPLRDPVIEYPNARLGSAPVSGVAVIGGYRYRGSAMPALAGDYVFADLQASGRLFAATPPDDGSADASADGGWPTRVLPIEGDAAAKLDQCFSFGRDADGELYVLGRGRDGGGVHRLVPSG